MAVELNKITEIVRNAGEYLLEDYEPDTSSMDISVKTSNRDLATKYDTDVQFYILSQLKFLYPHVNLIGEEDMGYMVKPFNTNDEFFIIDPVDGTTNLVHNYRHSAISVAYVAKGEVLIGVIYDPYMDEMFYAEKNKGAYLNGKRIEVSSTVLKDSLCLFGTSPSTQNTSDKTFEMVKAIFNNAQDIRRSGSATLDMCYVACGRAGLFFELNLFPWDYAAGSLINNEAGGKVSDLNKNSLSFDKESSVLAGNMHAYDEGYKVLYNG